MVVKRTLRKLTKLAVCSRIRVMITMMAPNDTRTTERDKIAVNTTDVKVRCWRGLSRLRIHKLDHLKTVTYSRWPSIISQLSQDTVRLSPPTHQSTMHSSEMILTRMLACEPQLATITTSDGPLELFSMLVVR